MHIPIIIYKRNNFRPLPGLLAATLLAVGCDLPVSPERGGLAAPTLHHTPGSEPAVFPLSSGLGTLGTESATPGSDRQDFDFEVRSEEFVGPAGRLFVRDWRFVRPDGTVATLTVDVDADPATRITATRDLSAACAAPSRGAEFDGTGRLDTGTLVDFTVAACDDGAAESGADFFRIDVPSLGYSHGGLLSSGDIVKPGPGSGDLTVTATTTGSDLDPDGYIVRVGTTHQAVATNGSVTFEGVFSGSKVVKLTASNGPTPHDSSSPTSASCGPTVRSRA